jgi:hypothetical protein
MLATTQTLAELGRRSKGAETDLERVRAKRRWLESKMGQRWNRRLSLEIDACLSLEDILVERVASAVTA